MTDKSRWQQEFDALPEWAQQLVRGMAKSHGYGYGGEEQHVAAFSSEVRARISFFYIFLDKDNEREFSDGFRGMRALSHALSAPWPPPAAPVRKRRAVNIVEFAASAEGESDCSFDQPCCFGHRVENYAVYCHNEAWPDSPRKCRRNREDYRHEDCPGFVANPDFQSARD